ncbi:MAG: GNAT family N-acetyltransferase [bacterium]
MIANHTSFMRFEQVSRCSALWYDIFNKANNKSPFVSYEWFTALCNSILNDDPEIMICWDKSRPIGIIPGVIRNNTLTFLIDERVTDLIDIIALPGYEHQIVETLASFITSNDLQVNISPLETESPLCKMLPALVNDITMTRADICPILTLADSWTEYLNGLSAKLRHELRRKMRKASEFEIRTVDRSQLDIFFKLMAVSNVNKANFLQEEIYDFFDTIADLFSTKQWLRMRTAFADSKPIAALYAFQMNDHIYLYNSGFDPIFSRSSPGIVLIGKDIMAAIDEGMKYYDFLRGDEEYKSRFGAQTRYTMRLMR